LRDQRVNDRVLRQRSISSRCASQEITAEARRILTVAREKLAPNERFGFVAYFDVLKRTNEKAPQHQKQAIEELLVQALAAYLPQR
jgi:hypothetical protein